MRLLLFAVFLIVNLIGAKKCNAQTGTFIWTNGAPTTNPGASGARFAVDRATFRWYEWVSGTTWIGSGDRIQQISGCSAPNYTPGIHNSRIVINSCTDPEIYIWNGSTWKKPPGSSGGGGTSIDSIYYAMPTSPYCKEYFVQEYERKDSNLLVIVLGDSKTEETYRGIQQLSRKLVLSRGTPYGGGGFGCFACTPAQSNWFSESGVTIVSGGVAAKSLNNKGLRLNTVGSYYQLSTTEPPWGNWKKITYTVQQEASASSLTVNLDGVNSTVNIPSGSALSTFSITATANTAHTIRFTQLTGTTMLLNYFLTSEEQSATSVWNIGNSGASASRWNNVIFDDDWDIIKKYDPNMFIIRLGINDAFGGLGSDLFLTEMRGLLQKIKAKFPLANIVLAGTEQTLSAPPDYIEYNAAMATLSQDSCYGFVDMNRVWPSWSKATELGLTADDVHENTAGGEFVGKSYFETLMGRSDITASSASINYWKQDSGNVTRETGNVGIGIGLPAEKLHIEGLDSAYIKINIGQSGSFLSPIHSGLKFFGGNPNFLIAKIESVNEISNRASADIRFVLRNSAGGYTEAGRFSGLTGGLSLNTSALEALFEMKSKFNTNSTRAISIRNSSNAGLFSVLDGGNRAGVGTSLPAYDWEIYGANPILAIHGTTFGETQKINFMTAGSVEGFIQHEGVNLKLSSGRNSSWGGTMSFFTDASQRMSISSTGNVSISNLSSGGNTIVQANAFGILQSTGIDPATITTTIKASATLDFPSTGAHSSSDLTATVTGAAVGDVVTVAPGLAAIVADGNYTAWVSATNTVTVRFNHYGAGSSNPSSASFNIIVTKY